MIGHYPHLIGALLLIYLHSTNQTFYEGKLDRIQQLLREEKSMGDGSSVDIACDRLDPDEKRQLCNKVMELMIFLEHDIGNPRSESFLNKESIFRPPRLINPREPFKCKDIPIEGLPDMKKSMFWCPHVVWQEGDSDEIHVRGVFLSSGRKVLDSAFLFRPLPTKTDVVFPVIVMEQVDLLSKKAQEESSSCGEN